MPRGFHRGHRGHRRFGLRGYGRGYPLSYYGGYYPWSYYPYGSGGYGTPYDRHSHVYIEKEDDDDDDDESPLVPLQPPAGISQQTLLIIGALVILGLFLWANRQK